MPEIEIAESPRSTIVGVVLDRKYEQGTKIKILQDAIRELKKEVTRLENLAF